MPTHGIVSLLSTPALAGRQTPPRPAYDSKDSKPTKRTAKPICSARFCFRRSRARGSPPPHSDRAFVVGNNGPAREGLPREPLRTKRRPMLKAGVIVRLKPFAAAELFPTPTPQEPLTTTSLAP